MQINKKITLLILSLFVLLSIVLAVYLKFRINQNQFFLENLKTQQEQIVKTALSTKSNIAKTLVFDYTYWDEVVDYIEQKKDKEWENTILATIIPTYKTNAVWVLNMNRTNIYHANNVNDSVDIALNPEKEIFDLLDKNHFIHFFKKTNHGIIEIHGATAHPSNDIERKTPPRGYFFIGQLYDTAYLSQLTALTNCNLDIVDNDTVNPEDKSQIRTVIPLFDSFNNNISYLIFTKKYNNIENLYKISIFYFVSLIIAVILSLILLYFSLNQWVNKPLGEIMNSLSNNKTENLAQLLKEKNEFGKIAELLINFMNQKQILHDEISKRELAEQAFSDQEKLYKSLFNNKLIGIVFSKNYKIIDANACFLKFISFRKFNEIKALNILDLFTENSRTILLEQLSYTKIQNNIELELIGSENSVMNVMLNYQNVEIENVIYQLFFFNDISEKKKIENELVTEKQYFQHLFNESPDAIVITDSECKIIKTNKSFSRLFGYTEDEIIGKTTTELFADKTNREEIQSLIRRILNGETISFETTRINKAGDKIDTQILGTPFALDSNKTGIYAIYRDISEKKKYHEELKSKGLLFKSIANILSNLWKIENESISINLFLKSIGQITNTERVYIIKNHEIDKNPMMKLLYEWTKTPEISVINNSDFNKIAYLPDYKNWFNALKAKDEILIKYSVTNKEKLRFLNQSLNSLMLIPIHINSEFWGFIGFDNCISEYSWNDTEISIIHIASNNISSFIERKNIENELINARKIAEESDKLKTNFIANMSHELRTPLNGMLGFAELLDDELVEPSHKDMIDVIQKSGLRLMDTLNSILDLSLIEANSIVLNKFSFDIKSLINEKIELYRKNASIKNLYLHFDAETNYQIFTDFKLLSRIVSNILDNAVKYTKKGGISIVLETETTNDENYLLIKIKDTGIGIDEKNYEYIFNHFTQVSNGLSREYEGSGIGLSICKKYIDLLNGNIIVESKINKGSSFIIKVPGLILNEEKLNSDVSKSLNSKKARILLVEDEISNREYTFYVLSKEFEVDLAENGLEALEMIKSVVYDAVLMDINLGRGLSGVETVKEIRKNENYSNTPIAAVTANAMHGHEESYLRDGMTHYISKPYNRSEIINLVYLMLKK